MPNHLGRAAACLALTSSLALTACARSEGAADPNTAAAKLADGLSRGSLADVPITTDTQPGAQENLTRAYKGMGGRRPKVTVKNVQQNGDAADVTLHHVWDLDSSGQDWAYDTHAEVRWVDGNWQVKWNPIVVAKDLQSAEVLRVRTGSGQRAGITGQGGQPIVANRAVWRVGLDKSKIPSAATQDSSARRLATALELDPEHFAKVTKEAGAQAFVPFLTVRADGGLTKQQSTTIDTTPGAVKIPDRMALPPTRGFAQTYLGRVTEATAEDVNKSGGKLAPGDTVGKGGLQARYDAQLRGTTGVKVVAVNPNTTDLGRLLYQSNGAEGKPLRTTLDVKAQNAADAALATVKNPSAAVVIKVSTGEVLAVSNGPQGYDTATLGQMAPGSTFKVATSLALLRTGMTPDSKVDCPERTTVQGRTFQNYADYPKDKNGSIPLRDAVAHSCNTAFILQADKVDQKALYEAAEGLGLATPAGDKRSVFLASIPQEATGTEHAAAMIGQGKNLASPLGMATVMASVMRGATVTPVLLPDAEPPTPLQPARPVTSAEAAQLRTLMRAVVTDGGGSALKNLPGPPVIAKTGTAEYGTGGTPKRHTWMIAGQGDYAVAVFVEDGEFGSTTCGPVMATLLKGLQ